MTDTVERVGYKNPPIHTRWKKGESGNPARKHSKRERGFASLIDEGFAENVTIIEAGVPRTVTAFEAIMLQLWNKATAGNKRALTVYLEYRKLAARLSGGQRMEFHVIPDETLTSATPIKKEGDGNV
jgi:hypothetical protein